MNRFFELFLIISLGLFLLVPFLIIIILIKLDSKGPIFYFSQRIGKGNQAFSMPKLRTMKVDTPQVASHLLQNPEIYQTQIGNILRRTSFDEIPQILSVIKGDMRLVGPRPALFNQTDLIELRTKRNIHTLKPGITGWAQINGRDELSILNKVKFDKEYLDSRSFRFDIYIIWLTIKKVVWKEGVSH